MMDKSIIFLAITIFTGAQAGVLPGAFVAPYASSYNAHAVNHAIAAPFAATPFVAPAPLVSGPPAITAPFNALPVGYSGLPAPITGLPAPISGLPAPFSGLPAPFTGLPAPYTALPAPYNGLPVPF